MLGKIHGLLVEKLYLRLFRLERVEDFRIHSTTNRVDAGFSLWRYQFLVFHGQPRGAVLGFLARLLGLKPMEMLRGDTTTWLTPTLKIWRRQGVAVDDPRYFQTRWEFEEFAQDHPVLSQFDFDWPEIRMDANPFC